MNIYSHFFPDERLALPCLLTFFSFLLTQEAPFQAAVHSVIETVFINYPAEFFVCLCASHSSGAGFVHLLVFECLSDLSVCRFRTLDYRASRCSACFQQETVCRIPNRRLIEAPPYLLLFLKFTLHLSFRALTYL